MNSKDTQETSVINEEFSAMGEIVNVANLPRSEMSYSDCGCDEIGPTICNDDD